MLPAIAYAPRAVTKPTAREAAHTLLRSPDAGSPDANTSGSSAGTSSAGPSMETHEVLYRAGDIVAVRPVSGGMWVGQLSEPIIKITGADGVHFNLDRPKVRYFVPAVELGSYPHAMTYWSTGQGGIRIGASV